MAEQNFNHIEHQLRERIKEQQCLYRIFQVTDSVTKPLDEILGEVVGQIASGFQYPEQTSAVLQWGTRVWQSSNLRPSENELQVGWFDVQEHHITLHVYCSHDVLPDEEVFLEEERRMLQTIIYRIAEVINRTLLARSMREKELLIRTMYAQTTDSIMLVDPETSGFIDFNDAACRNLGYHSRPLSTGTDTFPTPNWHDIANRRGKCRQNFAA